MGSVSNLLYFSAVMHLWVPDMVKQIVIPLKPKSHHILDASGVALQPLHTEEIEENDTVT